MNRRSYLASSGAGIAALGSAIGLAGCLASDSSDGGGTDQSRITMNDASTIDLRYPELQWGYHTVETRSAESAESVTAFETLSTASQVEIANAVARGRILASAPAVLEDDAHHQPIAYRGQQFTVSVAVLDQYWESGQSPPNDPEWRDPAEIAVAVEGDELAVELRNVSDGSLPVYDTGGPPFGSLLAVNETAVSLEHLASASSESVREADDDAPIEDDGVVGRRAASLDPGASLTERYGIPSDHPADARIRLAVRIWGDVIEQWTNGPVTAIGTYVLE